jgi:4-amino-4-deoxy-L-arabinose transferase-like glycosyltransferase
MAAGNELSGPGADRDLPERGGPAPTRTTAERAGTIPAGGDRICDGIALGLILLACGMRLVLLGADPSYYGFVGYVTDEGRWVEHARSLAQRGTAIEHNHNAHLILAPLFQLFSYLAFAALGVGRVAARLLPALSGCLLLPILWLFLRRNAGSIGALTGLAVVVFQADMVVLSRVALPEMPAMLCALLVLVILASGAPSKRRCFAAGLLAAAAVGFKGTSLSFAAIGALMALAIEPAQAWRARIQGALAYLLGLLVPATLVLIFAAPFWIERRFILLSNLTHMAEMLELAGAFGMLSWLFFGAFAPVLVSAGIGPWLALLTRFSGGPREGSGFRKALRGSTIWLALFTVVMLSQSYFPSRYQVHALVPLAILTGLGCSALLDTGWKRTARGLAARRGAYGILAALALALPTAVILAPALAAAAGVAAERLRERLLFLGLALVLVTATAWWVRGRPRAVASMVTAPIAWSLLWLAAWALTEQGIPFWPGAPRTAVAWPWIWLGLTLAAAATGASVAALATLERGAAARALGATASLWLVALWFLHLLPGFLWPSFTVRGTSRELSRMLARAESVGESRAEGLFLDNAIEFRRIDEQSWAAGGPSHLVLTFRYLGDVERLRRHYTPLRSFDLELSRYRHADSRLLRTPEGHHVTVYVRRDLAAAARGDE